MLSFCIINACFQIFKQDFVSNNIIVFLCLPCFGNTRLTPDNFLNLFDIKDKPVHLLQFLEIDRYLDFTDISVSAKTADIVSASVGVNETLLFLMHPENLRKKAQ